MRFLYTDEMDAFIRDHCEGRDLVEAARLFNEHFGTSVSVSAMRTKYKALGLRVGVKRAIYSEVFPEEVFRFIEQHNQGRTSAELADLLNRTFGRTYTEAQIRAFRKNHNMPCGVDRKFKPGQIPWTAGKTIEEICKTPEALARVRGSQYKPGRDPWNTVPVGTEIEREGYIWIKTGQPNHWRAKHRIVYEKTHGCRLGREDIVTFLDGNPRNMDPENLVLISKKENLLLTRWNLRSENPEITRTGVAVSKLHVAIERREKDEEQSDELE